jgi:hypothetical protein
MSHSRSLRQLLRIRQIEEEQSRTLLEAALGELNRLERALVVARERELKGRALVQASLRQGSMVRMGDAATRDIFDAANPVSEEGIDRLAGVVDVHSARRLIESLTRRLKAQEGCVEQQRSAFLAHRVERRQAETLIAEERARHMSEVDHRAQQAIDDWFGGRLIRQKQTASARKDRT